MLVVLAVIFLPESFREAAMPPVSRRGPKVCTAAPSRRAERSGHKRVASAEQKRSCEAPEAKRPGLLRRGKGCIPSKCKCGLYWYSPSGAATTPSQHRGNPGDLRTEAQAPLHSRKLAAALTNCHSAATAASHEPPRPEQEALPRTFSAQK